MFPVLRLPYHFLIFAVAIASSLAACFGAHVDTELRALWVDAFHAGLTNASQISQLVADARAANFNALFVEIRKRGDAYYNGSPYEPKSPEVSAEFDPLAYLIAKGHDTQNGPRLEIHAWITVYPIWRERNVRPSQPNHPINRHPDWLSEAPDGSNYDGHEYGLDPGHPEVQRYVYDVVMDILSRYDVDGINLDYLHYQGKTRGYNPVSVGRFDRLYQREGKPSPDDGAWCQFRRDQVTALLRKIYLSALAAKPQVKVSVGTITYYPGPANEADWLRSNPYNSLFQDWRGWMEEGILDINMPMAYLRQNFPKQAETFARWNTFAKNHRYNRQVVISPAMYLNTVSNALFQIRSVRDATSTGGRADGVGLYSYASYSKEDISREAFWDALVQSSKYDPNVVPPFATPASVPEMPWKKAPTKGHLKGFVYGGDKTNALDGATLSLTGPKNRTLVSDATGFFGAVDLPPGDYALVASFADYHRSTNALHIEVGKVSTRDVLLEK